MITTWAALESMAARLAAERASPDDIKALHQLTDPYTDVDRHMGEYSDANIRFHQAIIRAGGNGLIENITDSLFMHVRAIRNRTIFEQDRAKRSVADHKTIVAAIEDGNADLAEKLVREHTLKLRAHVEPNHNFITSHYNIENDQSKINIRKANGAATWRPQTLGRS